MNQNISFICRSHQRLPKKQPKYVIIRKLALQRTVSSTEQRDFISALVQNAETFHYKLSLCCRIYFTLILLSSRLQQLSNLMLMWLYPDPSSQASSISDGHTYPHLYQPFELLKIEPNELWYNYKYVAHSANRNCGSWDLRTQCNGNGWARKAQLRCVFASLFIYIYIFFRFSSSSSSSNNFRNTESTFISVLCRQECLANLFLALNMSICIGQAFKRMIKKRHSRVFDRERFRLSACYKCDRCNEDQVNSMPGSRRHSKPADYSRMTIERP